MSNGFVPRLPKAEVRRLEQALDRLDETGSFTALKQWLTRLFELMGSGYQHWLDQRAEKDLGLELYHRLNSAVIKLAPPEVQQQAREMAQSCLTEELTAAGMVLGKDFSFSPEKGILLSDAAKETLLSNIPPNARKRLEQELVEATGPSPWQLVEERLGVPFVSNLLLRVDELIQLDTPPEAWAEWIDSVGRGVSRKVVGDADDMALSATLVNRMEERKPGLWQQVLDAAEAEQVWSAQKLMENGMCPMTDVVRAAGASEENGELMVHRGRADLWSRSSRALSSCMARTRGIGKRPDCSH